MRFLILLCSLLPILALASAAVAQDAARPPEPDFADLQRRLETPGTGAEARRLEMKIRALFNAEMLAAGARPRLQGVLALFAIDSPSGAPSVRDGVNLRAWDLKRIGDSSLYAGIGALQNFRVANYEYQIDGKTRSSGALRVEHFTTHPDSLPREGTPKGEVRKMAPWRSKIFDGTIRDWWIYIPAQYRPGTPAAVMVFQDGEGYLRDASQTATVFDNLIHNKYMPVTVGIFIDPGVFEDGRRNRSLEYDTLSDDYARFLRDEILPAASKVVELTDDPERRAICGISSGGICAFTAAWEMPDLFRKVLSQVGSFTNIAAGPTLKEGGHNYPALIRKGPKKPLRVFLQDGVNDLDNSAGNWPLANQEMAAALKFRGYDYNFVMGEGFHSKAHGAAIFPDSLRWLWRDVK